MKILVTGGAGYVGSVLVPFLSAAGHDIVVLDLVAPSSSSRWNDLGGSAVHAVKGDICDAAVVRNAMNSCDAVVHLAAIVGAPACASNPAEAVRVNTLGSKVVACAAERHRIVVFASTGSCYGVVNEVCTESTRLMPTSVYGETKAKAEAIIVEECEGVVLRFATGFGISPRQRMDLLVHDLTREAVRNRKLVLYQPDAIRGFIHVHDMARAIHHVLLHSTRMRGHVFNVGDESNNCTKRELAERIVRHIPDTLIEYVPSGHDPDNRDYWMSYERIRKTGFSCLVGLDKGVVDILDMLRSAECSERTIPGVGSRTCEDIARNQEL